jgi:hypothetical protein
LTIVTTRFSAAAGSANVADKMPAAVIAVNTCLIRINIPLILVFRYHHKTKAVVFDSMGCPHIPYFYGIIMTALQR